MMNRSQSPPGSPLDDWLEDEGLLEHSTAKAIKSMLAWQIAQAMKARRISKSTLARQMRTNLAAVDRLLDPSNTMLTLRTLTRTALALRMDLEVRLVAPRPRLRAQGRRNEAAVDK
jgi:antitoxin HicB